MDRGLSVTIAGAGRFHIFDLAREMQANGVLHRLYTSYPKWKVKEVDPGYLKTAPWLSVPLAVLGRAGLDHIQEALYPTANRLFDHWLSIVLEQSDIFHCLSGYGARAHRVAKEKYGARTICDRGSAHIEVQRDLLVAEHNRWGKPHRWTDKAIQLDLQEYYECDMIMTPSYFVQRTFLEKGFSKEKIAVIPYGVDISLFHPVKKTDTVFRVIYVGTLSLQKGIPYLLEAFSGLGLPNFEVWLIGGLTNEIKDILRKYSGPFRYFGFIPRTELYKYYSQGSVFILPSIQDGFGLVLPQAMACGLPVIATTNTGAENLYTDGVEGYIVPIRDSSAIREKVIYLYENPKERDLMAERALAKVHNMGGWHSYGQAMLDVYQKLIINNE